MLGARCLVPAASKPCACVGCCSSKQEPQCNNMPLSCTEMSPRCVRSLSLATLPPSHCRFVVNTVRRHFGQSSVTFIVPVSDQVPSFKLVSSDFIHKCYSLLTTTASPFLRFHTFATSFWGSDASCTPRSVIFAIHSAPLPFCL